MFLADGLLLLAEEGGSLPLHRVPLPVRVEQEIPGL